MDVGLQERLGLVIRFFHSKSYKMCERSKNDKEIN